MTKKKSSNEFENNDDFDIRNSDLSNFSNSDSKLVIVNNEPRGIDLPIIKEFPNKTLLPGENSISEKHWEEVKRNPGIKIFINAGFLENKGKGKARPILNSLDSFSLTEARNMIKKEKDKIQVERWLSGTEKQHLVKALELKIERMK